MIPCYALGNDDSEIGGDKVLRDGDNQVHGGDKVHKGGDNQVQAGDKVLYAGDNISISMWGWLGASNGKTSITFCMRIIRQ